ncbi:MAG: sulfurtransferase TusA family protein [Thermaerobacter sp.]|nr:sulfurtransferase TusA family protein [Thermaerobacter sp.]
MRADATLDASGLYCIAPVAKLKEALGKLTAGQVLEVITTTSGTCTDIPAWCRRTGNELLATEAGGGTFRFYVRKAGG